MEKLIGDQKKRKKAVAIQYNEQEIAPKVLAKGAGIVAEKIVEKGMSNDIAVHEDAFLVEDLTRLDIGEHIPEELYLAVAQVLVFINELDMNREDRRGREAEKNLTFASANVRMFCEAKSSDRKRGFHGHPL